jgi:hypothetical protein
MWGLLQKKCFFVWGPDGHLRLWPTPQSGQRLISKIGHDYAIWIRMSNFKIMNSLLYSWISILLQKLDNIVTKCKKTGERHTFLSKFNVFLHRKNNFVKIQPIFTFIIYGIYWKYWLHPKILITFLCSNMFFYR